MSKKFSVRAERVLKNAQAFAKQYGYEQVEILHVLLAIATESGSFCELLIKSQGSTLAQLSEAVMQHISVFAPNRSAAPLPESSSLKELKNLAQLEAGGKTIETEHLLVAVLHMPDDLAYKALHSLDVHYPRTKRMISGKKAPTPAFR